jgi:glycosyltransferase involved in cell wall biosynthesis
VFAQNVSEVVVVDGGSLDGTADQAAAAGARVIVEPRRGYGRAIQTGIAAVRSDAEILVFLDGDGSDPVEFVPDLVSPIIAGQAVFVLGSRIRGARERGSLTPQQIVAAHVGRLLLRLAYGASFTDLSPFRAIRRDVLDRLGMSEMTYGWNLEMLMRIYTRDRCRPTSSGWRRFEGFRQFHRGYKGDKFHDGDLRPTRPSPPPQDAPLKTNESSSSNDAVGGMRTRASAPC